MSEDGSADRRRRVLEWTQAAFINTMGVPAHAAKGGRERRRVVSECAL